MTSNGAHDPREHAGALGSAKVAAVADDWAARGLGSDAERLRALYRSGPPEDVGRLRDIVALWSASLERVEFRADKGEVFDPRWQGYQAKVRYLPAEAVGVQSSACPWRLLPNGRIEYDYPIAPWSVPFVAHTQLPVVLRIQVWRPPEPGYLEGYWSPSTSRTTPQPRDRHDRHMPNMPRARWSLCDLSEDTTAKQFDAWIKLYRRHAARGPRIGGSQNSWTSVDAFVAACREELPRLAAAWGADDWRSGRLSQRPRRSVTHLAKTQFAPWIGISTRRLYDWLEKSHNHTPRFDWSDIEQIWGEFWR